MKHDLKPSIPTLKSNSTPPADPQPFPGAVAADTQALSDHETRLHFFDRFAKRSAQPARTLPVSVDFGSR